MGVDVVAVDRIVRLLGEHEPAAASLFTSRERHRCGDGRRSGERFAARFAAKEAVLKAFGTGMAGGLRWTEIEIVNEASGRPSVELHGAAAAFAHRRGLRQLEVSLTHSGGLALAHAVALFDGTPCAFT